MFMMNQSKTMGSQDHQKAESKEKNYLRMYRRRRYEENGN